MNPALTYRRHGFTTFTAFEVEPQVRHDHEPRFRLRFSRIVKTTTMEAALLLLRVVLATDRWGYDRWGYVAFHLGNR